jgi:Zn-dependent protease
MEADTIRDVFIIGLVIYGTSLHEMGHAFVANWLGDPTPGRFGRLTLNPLPHLSPIFTAVFLPIITYMSSRSLFCLAQTPVDPSRLRHPLRDHALLSLAGPAMNFLLAGVLIGILWLPNALVSRDGQPTWVAIIFPKAAFWNLLLGVFNLIPVPPLDGYSIIRPVVPLGARRQADAFARSGTIALLVAIIVASVVFRYLADPLLNALSFLLPPEAEVHLRRT